MGYTRYITIASGLHTRCLSLEFSTQGPIGDALVAKVQASGGILTLEDLKTYEPHVMPALQGTYRGRKIYTTHAPTSGPVLLHMLNLLEHFDDFVEEGRTGLNVHRIVEATKCTCSSGVQFRCVYDSSSFRRPHPVGFAARYA